MKKKNKQITYFSAMANIHVKSRAARTPEM
jgi:hypothetical protein